MVPREGKLVGKLRGEIENLRQEHGEMDTLMSSAAKALNREVTGFFGYESVVSDLVFLCLQVHRNATLKKELEDSKKQLTQTKQELAAMQADKDEVNPMSSAGANSCCCYGCD